MGSHFGYNYRVIHEETGQEISGTYSTSTQTMRVAANNNSDLSIDVSSLPDGELVVIANVLDENGKIETSKSTRVNKMGQSSVSEIRTYNNKVLLNGRTVTVFSDTERNITVTTIDGRQNIHPVVNGKTTFELPDAGFYIIDGQKFVVK